MYVVLSSPFLTVDHMTTDVLILAVQPYRYSFHCQHTITKLFLENQNANIEYVCHIKVVVCRKGLLIFVDLLTQKDGGRAGRTTTKVNALGFPKVHA